ncbi:MAG: hypothetical protein ABR549_08545 [Mycobacteriales bacterium]
MVVHCAAPGLQYRPLVPIWAPGAITLQPIRAGFPCFGAALAGHAEASIADDDEKNRLCPPSPYPDTPTSWTAMQLLGTRASMAFNSDPGLKAWADGVALNPSRVPPELIGSAEVAAAAQRFRQNLEPGLASMAVLAAMA